MSNNKTQVLLFSSHLQKTAPFFSSKRGAWLAAWLASPKAVEIHLFVGSRHPRPSPSWIFFVAGQPTTRLTYPPHAVNKILIAGLIKGN